MVMEHAERLHRGLGLGTRKVRKHEKASVLVMEHAERLRRGLTLGAQKA